MSLISSRTFQFVAAGALAALAATASIAPAEAGSGFSRSGPNPVLKCLGADCNDVATRHNKRKGPNVQVCAEEVYTENGAVMKPIDPRYCAE